MRGRSCARALDETLAREAAAVSRAHGLRGYDAVHCAAAVSIDGPDVVAVSGDGDLLAAWHDLGLATIDTGATPAT